MCFGCVFDVVWALTTCITDLRHGAYVSLIEGLMDVVWRCFSHKYDFAYIEFKYSVQLTSHGAILEHTTTQSVSLPLDASAVLLAWSRAYDEGEHAAMDAILEYSYECLEDCVGGGAQSYVPVMKITSINLYSFTSRVMDYIK